MDQKYLKLPLRLANGDVPIDAAGNSVIPLIEDGCFDWPGAVRAINRDHLFEEMLATLKAALPDIASEAFQREHSGNDEEFQGMKDLAARMERVIGLAEPAAVSPPDAPAFAVVLEGGLVSSVISTNPEMAGVKFAVIDYDTDGADLDELLMVPQGNGKETAAVARVDEVEVAGIPLHTFTDWRQPTEAEA